MVVAFEDFWLDGLDTKRVYEVTISANGKMKRISMSLNRGTISQTYESRARQSGAWKHILSM